MPGTVPSFGDNARTDTPVPGPGQAPGGSGAPGLGGGYSMRSSTTTGICRVVFVWYSS